MSNLPQVKTIGNYIRSVVTESHKRLKRDVNITTIIRKDKAKLNMTNIQKLGARLLDKNPNKKLMIKVLSSIGYFSLKGYDDPMSKILSEYDNINGREEFNDYSIYKVSFYLL